jgi:hypothetical protein
MSAPSSAIVLGQTRWWSRDVAGERLVQADARVVGRLSLHATEQGRRRANGRDQDAMMDKLSRRIALLTLLDVAGYSRHLGCPTGNARRRVGCLTREQPYVSGGKRMPVITGVADTRIR